MWEVGSGIGTRQWLKKPSRSNDEGKGCRKALTKGSFEDVGDSDTEAELFNLNLIGSRRYYIICMRQELHSSEHNIDWTCI